MQEKILLNLFKDFQLDYQLHTHEAVFTVEDSNHVCRSIRGAHSKNLFLKDKKKTFFLVSILDNKRINLKSLSKMLGKNGLSFGNPDELLEKLKLSPGSVTPYALIHDQKKEVSFILDQDFLKFEMVNFHPLRNDMTIGMPVKSFLHFINKIDHAPKIMEIPLLN